ncbi:MAG: hypothetical protein WC551_01865 [Patescibacteria group bacterium]
MRKIICTVFGLAISLLTSTAAMAQDQDAAAAMGAGNITTNAAICQQNGDCLKALAQCEESLKTSQQGAEAALNAQRQCQERLVPVVPKVKKTAPPAPPACSGAHAIAEGSWCGCHVNVDGTGDIDPALIPVRKFGAGNLVVCVSGPEALRLAREAKLRIDMMDKKVPGWNDATASVNILLGRINYPVVPGVDAPKTNSERAVALAAMINNLYQWIADENERMLRINIFLDNDLPSLKVMREKYCPPISGKSGATWEERCQAGIDALKDTRVSATFGARGGVIGTPVATGGMVVATAELAYYPARKSSYGIVVGAYGGIMGDNNRSTQYIFGTEIGPRFFLDDEKHLSIDVLGYGQSRRFAKHSDNYRGAGVWTGWDVGVRPRLRYCAGDSRAFCVGGDVSLGYTPGDNGWTGPYSMEKKPGLVWGAGLSLSGTVHLF